MKKILSLILAVSLIASLCVVSVSAAGAHTVHTTTLEVVSGKTEDLEAGDTVTIEVVLDKTEKLIAIDYAIEYDTAVFEIVPEGEAYKDTAWYNEIKGTEEYTWGYYLKTPTYSPKWDSRKNTLSPANWTQGAIKFSWAGGENGAIDPLDNETEKVIGKFNFVVKADVEAGAEGNIVVTGNSSDDAQAGMIAMVGDTATFTVKSAAAPVGPTVGAAADYTGNAVAGGKVAGITIKETDKKYDNCYAVSATIENAVGQIGVLFVPQDVNDWGKAADAVYGDNLGGGTVTINAALRGIPTSLAGRDIVMLSKAYALVDDNYTYGTELTTTINFDVTAE